MWIGRVTGTVVATQKDPNLHGRKMLLVQRLNLDLQAEGIETMVLDAVQAGEGDLVLVCSEGGSVNRVFDADKAPFDSAIVGIIDAIDVYDS